MDAKRGTTCKVDFVVARLHCRTSKMSHDCGWHTKRLRRDCARRGRWLWRLVRLLRRRSHDISTAPTAVKASMPSEAAAHHSATRRGRSFFLRDITAHMQVSTAPIAAPQNSGSVGKGCVSFTGSDRGESIQTTPVPNEANGNTSAATHQWLLDSLTGISIIFAERQR